MNTHQASNNTVNTQNIMEELKKQIKNQSVNSDEICSSLTSSSNNSAEWDDLINLALDCDPRVENKPITHRQDFSGKIILSLKNGLLKLFSLYGNALLHKQSLINHKITKHFLNFLQLFKKIEALQLENIALKKKIKNLMDDFISDGSKNSNKQEIIHKNIQQFEDDYLAFENIYRGARKEIKQRQEVYLSLFKKNSDILDVGCGRGEFLEVLKENNVSAHGIDLNDDMIHICKEYGLDAEKFDVIDYLEKKDDESIGGIFASQVIEHLTNSQLKKFIDLAHRKLRTNAYIALETVNPLTLKGMTTFYLDLSHVRPIHPLAIKFIIEQSAFSETNISYLSPVEKGEELETIIEHSTIPKEITTSYNNNIKKLNSLLYGYQDFAITARKV